MFLHGIQLRRGEGLCLCVSPESGVHRATHYTVRGVLCHLASESWCVAGGGF